MLEKEILKLHINIYGIDNLSLDELNRISLFFSLPQERFKSFLEENKMRSFINDEILFDKNAYSYISDIGFYLKNIHIEKIQINAFKIIVRLERSLHFLYQYGTVKKELQRNNLYGEMIRLFFSISRDVPVDSIRIEIAPEIIK